MALLLQIKCGKGLYALDRTFFSFFIHKVLFTSKKKFWNSSKYLLLYKEAWTIFTMYPNKTCQLQLTFHLADVDYRAQFDFRLINTWYIIRVSQGNYLYSQNIINVYFLLSHEWWVPLIKFMVESTIHVRRGSMYLWYSRSTW